jgi:hypothetical protein
MVFMALSLVARETEDHLSHKAILRIDPESSCFKEDAVPYRLANSFDIFFLRVHACVLFMHSVWQAKCRGYHSSFSY